MSNELLKKLEKSIVGIYDSNKNKIKVFDKIEIRQGISKYSSSHIPSVYLFVDGTEYHKNKKMYVEYICECGTLNKILLKRFLTKKSFKCRSCKEQDEAKRTHHSRVLMGIEKKKQKTPAKNFFEDETDDFKKKYFETHLTVDEFNKCKKYIYSVNNVIVKKDVVFLPHVHCNNQQKYSQAIILNGEQIPFKNIKLKCPLCGEIFSITRLLKHRVLSNNFVCKTCYFNNKTFAMKKFDENLTFQSQLELKFIELCINNNIKIQNGEKIKYIFNNKSHTYSIDFYLPDFKKQIEIKGNHVWHREQVKNGKWKAKQDAAINFCKENDMSYQILFEEQIPDFFKNLEKDSLNNNENY